jgi:two-component system phosphate regulon sensor histidine kinase PhoR
VKTKNKIIILITIISLIGLIISQFFLVKKTLETQKERTTILEKQITLLNKEFNNNVIISLTKVRDNLISLNKEASGIYLEPVKQINPNYFVVSFYDNLDKKLLKEFVEEEFQNYNITEEFQIGVYDCFSDSIIFDEYVSLSTSGNDTKYVPQKWEHDGYYFGVYFSNKKDTVIPENTQIPYSLIFASLLIIIVVLFFGYTTNTVLKQKKISDITTDFINNMTHELKTPISTISLSVDVLKKSGELEKNERLSRYINIIKTENKRLENQVERVLRIAKLEQGDIRLNFEDLCLHEIIEGCVETFSVPIQDRKGKLSHNLKATSSHIDGDLTHITNIIYNLLDNAKKYSEDAPNILIETINEDNKIKVLISDKGKGMKTEDLKFIFNKFYRVSTGDVHNVKGFGLGLYYVKQMITKHGGDIEVQSKLGEGTTFTIILPLKK